MDRTPEHIDNHFRNRLHDAATPPPAFVWENVESELRKRRRRVFIWMFSLGIVAAGLLGIWLANSVGSQQKTTNLEPTQPVAEMSQTTPAKEPIVEMKQPSVPQELTNTLGNTTPSYSNAVPETPQKTTPKGIQTLRSATSSVAIPTAINAAPAMNQVLEQPTETTPATLEAKPQKTFLEEKAVGKVFPMALLPLHPAGLISSGLRLPPTTGPVRKSWPGLHAPHPAKAKKAVKNCYDFAKQPKAWLLETYLGPSLAQRELISRPDDRPYLIKRLSSEQRDLAFNAGLRAALMLKGNFLLRTGLQYDQMTEVLEYSNPQYVKTSIVTVVLQNGTTTTDTIVEYGEKYQKVYNRFGMLDIPVMAGIELRKGRSGFNINAGMSFNVLFWKRGAILSPDTGLPTWFTPGKEDATAVFTSRAGLSATASVQWFYHVKPRLRIFVEPSFKKMLRPVTVGNHPVEQRYSIGGLRLGLTKILN